MGVLGQLQYNRVLERVDAISSVSGGGYSAYFYFSRLGLSDPPLPTDRPSTHMFADMVWAAYTSGLKGKENESLPISKEFRGKWSDRFGRCIKEPDPNGRCSDDEWSRLHRCDFFDATDGFSSSENLCKPLFSGKDRTVDQLHLSSWRDVLADSGAMPETLGDTDVHHKSQWLSELGLLSLLTTIPHNIANTLFDWRLKSSPSQFRYESGIHRTYGVKPSPRERFCLPTAAEEVLGDQKAKSTRRALEILCMYASKGEEELKGKELSYRFERLEDSLTHMEAYKRWPPLRLSDIAKQREGARRAGRHFPLWIINASVGKGGVAVDLATNKVDSFFERNFEFTPMGFGSLNGGYVRTSWEQTMAPHRTARPVAPPSWPIDDVPGGREDGVSSFTALSAVAASAAFLDPNHQSFARPLRLLAGSAMHLTNSKWGLDVPNYRVPDWRRKLHGLLPFPFYWLDGYPRGTESPYLHLSDGGHASDNLGIYALLRRGFREIIAVDASFDRTGRLDDLCHLRSNLWRFHRVSMEIDNTQEVGDREPLESNSRAFLTLGEVCGNRDEPFDLGTQVRQAASIFLWERPILRLKVVGLHPRFGTNGTVRVYYLKMAIDMRTYFPAGSLERTDGRILEDSLRACTAPFRVASDSASGNPGLYAHESVNLQPPCNIAVFQATNWGPKNPKAGWTIDVGLSDNGATEACWRPAFPQHGTETSTLNGSRRTHYAYRDLGAYLARGLGWNATAQSVTVADWALAPSLYRARGVCEGGYFPREEECQSHWCTNPPRG
ncbi:MAG: hypothetical protein HYZ17_08270 [Betaproteobacteria bacterium]|nr:hypothetical protein [Betaproteobacteria bacterium]